MKVSNGETFESGVGTKSLDISTSAAMILILILFTFFKTVCPNCVEVQY